MKPLFAVVDSSDCHTVRKLQEELPVSPLTVAICASDKHTLVDSFSGPLKESVWACDYID